MNCSPLRLAGLLAAGVMVVHDLRYRLAFGDDTSRMLAEQPHGYLALLALVVGLLLAAAVGQFIAQWAAGPSGSSPPRTSAMSLRVGGALIAIYTVQEGLEGALVGSALTAPYALLGEGAWLVPFLCALVAIAISFVVRVVDEVLERRGTAALRVLVPVDTSFGLPRFPLPQKGSVAARNLAGRGPPSRPG